MQQFVTRTMIAGPVVRGLRHEHLRHRATVGRTGLRIGRRRENRLRRGGPEQLVLRGSGSGLAGGGQMVHAQQSHRQECR